MIDYKQPRIIEELRNRILDGTYTAQLPTTAELAAEFGVNIKTMGKAIGHLVEEGRLERRKRCGTRVKTVPAAEKSRLIEVVFEGFTTIFTHPFWRDIWGGLVEKLAESGYRPVLTMLTSSDPATGLLECDRVELFESAAKVVLGIGEERLLRLVRESRVPFITACDPLGNEQETPQVTFDFAPGIAAAIDFLHDRNCRRIAFIGQTRSYVNIHLIGKFNCYLQSLQRYEKINPDLIEDARPLAEFGAPAMAAILDRSRPDAVLVAYDHLVPGVLEELKRRRTPLPVIGCDGLPLPEMERTAGTVWAPRRRCGEAAAELLLRALHDHSPVPSLHLPTEFRPRESFFHASRG